ncbi:hypothetical protein DID76_04125 [Candidatus Marinamargulisbacteria bacterium SCGC AG-414-C22]|nr:hypothetical protein DID76_04125 [Candidatus Marinamargulisbacteria bacterium SCGC AG-414-C22]
MKKIILAVIASGIWMNVNEFLRNELLLKDQWVSTFQNLGLTFPSAPINGLIWAIWTFLFCIVLTILCEYFSALRATVIAWSTGFVLMWVVLLNLGILPQGILLIAIPWSFMEVFIAAKISLKIIK